MKVEDIFNLDPIGKANLKIRNEIKKILSEKVFTDHEMIEAFSDDFY